MTLDLTSFDGLIRDMYALPGTRLKQWVVEQRREDAWERETCPRFDMPSHLDNTEGDCRNGGTAAYWTWLAHHDCCETCNDAGERERSNPVVAAWLDEKAARPPVTSDRDALSDEIEPEWKPLNAWPATEMLKRSPK